VRERDVGGLAGLGGDSEMPTMRAVMPSSESVSVSIAVSGDCRMRSSQRCSASCVSTVS
jgi:hypothetical protein